MYACACVCVWGGGGGGCVCVCVCVCVCCQQMTYQQRLRKLLDTAVARGCPSRCLLKVGAEREGGSLSVRVFLASTAGQTSLYFHAQQCLGKPCAVTGPFVSCEPFLTPPLLSDHVFSRTNGRMSLNSGGGLYNLQNLNISTSSSSFPSYISGVHYFG